MIKVVILVFHLLIFISFAESKGLKDHNIIKNETIETKICNETIVFKSPFEEKRSLINLSPSLSVEMIQKVSIRKLYGASLASNIICQSLTGGNYSGSKEEWQGFFKNTTNGLSQKGAKNLQLTIVGEKSKKFKGNSPHREYKFIGEFDEGKQLIYNLAALDLNSNTMYTISVSGDFKLESKIIEEFERLVSSFSFQ